MTTIGNHNYFMVFSHVGHDCHIGDHVVLTNAVLLAGHVSLEDHSVLSGGSAVHQFCRIGSYAMIGGHASVTKDVPPYMLVDDNEALIGSMNLVGMRRAGFIEEVKRDIKNAYKLLYLSGLNLTHAMNEIVERCHSREVAYMVNFMKDSKRGILGHRKQRGDQGALA
jgi:UDP-N-acetylglucosamine acyltransferase